MVGGEDGGLGGPAGPEAEQGSGGGGGRSLFAHVDLGPVHGVAEVDAGLAVLGEAAEVGARVEDGARAHGAEEVLDGQLALQTELGQGDLDVARGHAVVEDVAELFGRVRVVGETLEQLPHTAVGSLLLLSGDEGWEEDVHGDILALVGQLEDVHAELLVDH